MSLSNSPIRAIATAILTPVLLCCVQRAPAATPEVRGTWLTTTGAEDHIKSGTKTAAVMTDLRTIGLNTAYVETWKNGYTNYPSPTLAALTGGPDRSTFLGTSRDLVQETLIHAHRNQLNYVGWFEYGFSPQFIGDGGTPSNHLGTYMKNQNWLLKDQAGKYANANHGGFAWMNPAVPQVRQFLINIVLEAVTRYDLDGVQFDDRLAWPKEYGWDSTTAGIYLAETGRSLPSSVDDTNFRTWRQGKVTQFATELSQALRAVRPDILLSVSPSITDLPAGTGFAETQYNANWPLWQDQGLFDEYVPQAYRSSLSSFNSIIDDQVAPFEPDALDELAVGLRINPAPNTPYADVEAMIERTRTEGAAGHSLWYSKGVRDDYKAQLTSFYDVAGEGHAANPHFGSSRRLPPVVGSVLSAPAGTWTVDVSTPGHYRIVAKVGSFWTEVDTATFDSGEFVVTVPGASQVELLVDRRLPYFPDFTGDELVDAADYVLWRKTLGSTFDMRADASADGIINAADIGWWRRGFGKVVGGASSWDNVYVIAEPNGLGLLLAAFITSAAKRRSARSEDPIDRRPPF